MLERAAVCMYLCTSELRPNSPTHSIILLTYVRISYVRTYVYVYTYVYVCVCMYVLPVNAGKGGCMYIRMFVCMYVHTYVCIYIYVCMYVSYVCMCMYVYVCMYCL